MPNKMKTGPCLSNVRGKIRDGKSILQKKSINFWKVIAFPQRVPYLHYVKEMAAQRAGLLDPV